MNTPLKPIPVILFFCPALAILISASFVTRASLAGLNGTGPTHCRVIWTADPATEATVSWNSSTLADSHTIRFRRKGTNEPFISIDAESGRYSGGQTELYYYHARLSGLAPSTTYEFQVYCDDQPSREYYFLTGPDDERAFSILHGGDSRSDREERRRVNMMMSAMVTDSLANESQADDILAFAHGGDYVATGTDLEQWSGWFSDHEKTTAEDGRMLPIIPARGNHDTGKIFNEAFGFPEGDLNYYGLNLGPLVRLVTLNTETATAGDQAKWLDKELKTFRSQNVWMLAQYHRPAFPAVKAPGSALQSWVPIFEKHNMDLVCEADGHTIKRTIPIRGNVQDKTGVVYIGEGGLGVAQRTPKTERWYLRSPGMSDSASHVYVLSFSRDSLTSKCVKLKGGIADTFVLRPRKIEKVRAFVVTGDPQYLAENVVDPQQLDPYSEAANRRFIEMLKKLPGETIPADLGGGKVKKPLLGALVTGDLVDSADKTGGNYPAMQRFEWERYKSDYGLTGKDKGLPFPIYELHGNHDGPQGDTFIIRDIIARNKKRPGLKNISKNGLHYSWDWGPLHLVNLGIFVGRGQTRRDQYHYAPMDSLQFLIEDLETQVGKSGRPVVLAFHLHPNGPAYDWPPQDLKSFWDTIKRYNVVALFHGHTHGSPPSRIKWNETGFGPELANGIDLFNPDDSGAAKTNPKDPDNPLGMRHGCLYVELIDRPGKLADELVVRSILTTDNWKSRTWGEVWKKPIQIPQKQDAKQ